MKLSFLLLLSFSLFSLISCSGLIYNGKMNDFFLTRKNFHWNKFESNNFIFYYLPNSKAEKNLTKVEQKISSGIERAKKTTQIDSIKTPIYYFIVNDRNEFNLLTKLNFSGISYSQSNTIIESYFLIGEAHEVVHLITHKNWGNSYTWIMEGIAVYSDNEWNAQSLDKACYQLYKEQKLIPLTDFIKKSSFKKFNSQIAYPQSGSLVKYIIKTYGWEKFINFWKNPDLMRIYNLSIESFEKDWLNSIKEYSPS